MKKQFFTLCVLSSLKLFAAQNDWDILAHAGNSCSPSTYLAALSQVKDKAALNYSLNRVIDQCARSGKLTSLVNANIAHGGEIADKKYFQHLQWDAPCFAGYCQTALGTLARTSWHGTLQPDILLDVQAATKSLANNDGHTIDSALLDCADTTNFPVAQTLKELGAQPQKKVEAGSNPLALLSNNKRAKDEPFSFYYATKDTTLSAMVVAQEHLKSARKIRNAKFKATTFVCAKSVPRLGIDGGLLVMASFFKKNELKQTVVKDMETIVEERNNSLKETREANNNVKEHKRFLHMLKTTK